MESMRKRWAAVIFLVLFCLFFCPAAMAHSSEPQKDRLLDDLTNAAKDSLGAEDLEKLSSAISNITGKYRFSDKDIEKLGADAVSLVIAVSGFVDRINSPSMEIQVPRSETKAFFDELAVFLEKYRVTGEDTLTLGREVTIVIMGVQEKLQSESAAPKKESRPTKEGIKKIFSRLIDFSRKHDVQAVDIVPIAASLSDIALSAIEDQAVRQREEKAASATVGKRKTGVTGDQIMKLINVLMGFQKKYKVELSEVLQLADEIGKAMKQ